MGPDVPGDERESARLAALAATTILDTAQESCFDSLTRMAADICHTPTALVSLIDENRQWFKSRVGFGVIETPREFSFCSRAIETPSEMMIIPDASADPRFASNPLVVGSPNIRFYAGVPLVTRDGNALGTLCVIDKEPRVLTEQQLVQLRALADHARAQLELRRAFHDMANLTRDLRDQATDLRASNEALDAFAYSASHDLRAPLRRVALLVAELRHDEDLRLSDVGRQNLDRIERESRELRTLVDDMLALGHATMGELNPAPLDLAPLLRDIESKLRAREPGREVVLDIEGDLTTQGDRVLLSVALTNLLENAWKYTRRQEHPRVVVHGDHTGDGWLVVAVQDNGVGFDPAQAQDRLFRPFHRLHGDVEFKGTGVGLATVRRIVERHGGRIWAEGAPGKGATFHFTLPASTSP